MDKILLTPTEILSAVKSIDSEWKGYTDDYAIHENIAKAQLKKVMDKIGAYPREFDGVVIKPHIPKEDWQALRELIRVEGK